MQKHWMGLFARSPKSRSRRPVASNSFEVFEVRAMLSTDALLVDTLKIEAPHEMAAGQAFHIEVGAFTAAHTLATGYTGTVHFASSDANAVLPNDYTFTGDDHGHHEFTVTLSTVGSQNVYAIDTVTSSLAAGAAIDVHAAAVATQLGLLISTDPHVGQTVPVSVRALDASNHAVPNYTGTIHFTSSDGSATLPADYTFTADDHGHHYFQVTWGTTGAQTLTATDATTSTLTGNVSATVQAPAVVTHVVIRTPPNAPEGKAVPALVVALDASNHPVSNYTGTVHFASSDTAATLPADYTFTSADHGKHLFQVTWATTGSQTLTATDAADSTLTNQVTVHVGDLQRFFRVYNPNAGLHSFTTSAGEFAALVGRFHYSDESNNNLGFAVVSSQTTDSTSIHRLYNNHNGQHYYTTSAGERDALLAIDTSGNGWTYEGTQGAVLGTQASGAAQINMLYNDINGEHLFTTSATEVTGILAIPGGHWHQQTSLGFGYSIDQTGTFQFPVDTSDGSVSATASIAHENSDTGPTSAAVGAAASGTGTSTGSNCPIGTQSTNLPIASDTSTVVLGSTNDAPSGQQTPATTSDHQPPSDPSPPALDAFWSLEGHQLAGLN